MPYVKTVWTDETPASTPVKYKITDDTGGITNASAKIELVTSVTPGTPLNATNLNKMEDGIEYAHGVIADMFNLIYPIGTIYTSVNSTNPSTLFGGTWAQYAQGKVLVGQNAAETEFDTVEETGGEKFHALTKTEMPAHLHSVRIVTQLSSSFGAFTSTSVSKVNTTSYTTKSGNDSPIMVEGGTNNGGTYGSFEGNGVAHNNLQPYIVVYFFKRTA